MTAASFRARVRAGEVLAGTFIKTPAHHQAELLGLAGLDFAVADAEHAPIDLAAMDRLAAAARGVGLPLLTRIPTLDPVRIAAELDLGAAGIVAPHVRGPQDAEALLRAAEYGRGQRGFSPSPRAGRFGTEDAATYRARADAERVLVAQIEDAEALGAVDAIAAVEGIDALLIGPADLALSLGCAGPDDPALREAITHVAAAGRRHGRTVGIFIGRPEAAAGFAGLGISLFICGSDQSLLLAEAGRAARVVRASRTE